MEGRRQRGTKAIRSSNSDPEDDRSESRVDRRNPLGKGPAFTSPEPYESYSTHIPTTEDKDMKNQSEIEAEDPSANANANANLNDNDSDDDQQLIIYPSKFFLKFFIHSVFEKINC